MTGLPAGPGWLVCRDLEVANSRGLHARAAARFVKLAGSFAADIRVARNGTAVCGRSIMGLMMLAAAQGCTIGIATRGDDAEAAIQALADLVRGGFDEA